MTLTPIAFVEIAVRGAVVGLLMIVIWRLATASAEVRLVRSGLAFAFGTVAYVIVSTPLATVLGDLVVRLLVVVSTVNSVFFWWFATALFDDRFRWQAWRWLPFGILLAMALARWFSAPILDGYVDDLLHQALVVAMMTHALWLALRYRQDDLLEARRSLRIVFVVMLALAGISFAIAEIALFGSASPAAVSLLHAMVIFGLAAAFSDRVLELLVEPLIDGAATDAAGDPVEALARQRLFDAMDKGLYRTEGLTIGQFARAIDYPEHKLRRLINQSLGYRNFSAFLNDYRIADARELLADPDNTRTQITQIAFQLGYASLAPFNRAFREATATTPSEFRRAALAEALESD